METNKFKYLNYPGLDYDSVIYAIGKDAVETMAYQSFGYTLTDEELRQISEAIDDPEICGYDIINAINDALAYVIKPEKCNWALVDPSARGSMENFLSESKLKHEKTGQNSTF